MLWIGLTGGIATGKSSVVRQLKKESIPVLDADQIYHELIEPGQKAYKRIVSKFGNEILGQDGTIDRQKLGKIVFADPQKLKRLEALVHPLVRELTQQKKEQLFSKGNRIIINDVPLLYEKKLQSQYRFVALVYCDPKLQRARLKFRDNLSDEEIQQRLDAQIPIDEKMKLADYIIENNGTLEELEAKVLKFIEFCKSRLT